MDLDSDVLDVTDTDQLRALGHPARMRLLLSIGAEGATVSQLSTRLGTNKGNVAHHLAVLERAGLVRRGAPARCAAAPSSTSSGWRADPDAGRHGIRAHRRAAADRRRRG